MDGNEPAAKRRPGRPRTEAGTKPVRTTRQGPIWDEADTIARVRGETIHTVISRALSRYVARHQRELDAADQPPQA